jgi:hypothetical protein
MKSSNLASRLEEFAALEKGAQSVGRPSARMFVLAEAERTWTARHRLALGTYRIQIRDSGLRPFRVF